MHFIFSFLTHKHLCHLPVKLKTEGVNLIVKAHGVTIVLKTLFYPGVLTCTSHSWRIFLSPEEAFLTAADSRCFSIAETMRRALWTFNVSSICLVEAWTTCWGWQTHNVAVCKCTARPSYRRTGRNISCKHHIAR